MQGHLGAALGNRVNSRRLWEAGFVVLRRCGISWFPQKDVIGLLNNSASWQGMDTCYSGKPGTIPEPLDKEC